MSQSPEVEVSNEVSQAAMESWSRELDLRALAERFGTPLYLHHPATLRERFDLYARLVGEPAHSASASTTSRWSARVPTA